MNSNWLEEDPELLSATLAILDAWDGDSDGGALTATASSSDSQDASHSDSSSHGEEEITTRSKRQMVARAGGATPRGRPAKLSTHHRRREEMHVLRQQIETLEARIQEMQNGSNRDGAQLSVASLWQGVAQNQLRLRRQSELEQTKLRRMVQMQTAIAEGMAQLMRQAQEMQMEESMAMLQRDLTAERLELHPHSVEQFERINLIYANLEMAFAHAKFHEGAGQFVDIEIVHNDKEIVLEFREMWTVPFEALAALNALWVFTQKRYEEKWRLPGQQVLVNTDDAFVTQFVARAVMGGSLYAFGGQLVLRRFAEPTDGKAPAIVTNLYSSPTVSNEEDVLQVYLHEHSCLRVLELASPDGFSPLTRIQCTYHIAVKFDYDDDVKGRHHAGLLLDFVLQRLKKDVDVKRSTVESLLLQVQRSV